MANRRFSTLELVYDGESSLCRLEGGDGSLSAWTVSAQIGFFSINRYLKEANLERAVKCAVRFLSFFKKN